MPVTFFNLEKCLKKKYIYLWWKKCEKLVNESIYSEISECGSIFSGKIITDIECLDRSFKLRQFMTKRLKTAPEKCFNQLFECTQHPKAGQNTQHISHIWNLQSLEQGFQFQLKNNLLFFNISLRHIKVKHSFSLLKLSLRY